MVESRQMKSSKILSDMKARKAFSFSSKSVGTCWHNVVFVCMLRFFLCMIWIHHEEFPTKFCIGILFATAIFFAFNHTSMVHTLCLPACWTSTQSASSGSSSGYRGLCLRKEFQELFAVNKGTLCALHFLSIDSLMPSCCTAFLLPTSSPSLIASH